MLCLPRTMRLHLAMMALVLAIFGANQARPDMRSSWGGALGLTQFLPSEFYKYAVDFDGDGRAEWFEGNVQDYEADKMRRLGTGSIIPHRVKYKKFSR